MTWQKADLIEAKDGALTKDLEGGKITATMIVQGDDYLLNFSFKVMMPTLPEVEAIVDLVGQAIVEAIEENFDATYEAEGTEGDDDG